MPTTGVVGRRLHDFVLMYIPDALRLAMQLGITNASIWCLVHSLHLSVRTLTLSATSTAISCLAATSASTSISIALSATSWFVFRRGSYKRIVNGDGLIK